MRYAEKLCASGIGSHFFGFFSLFLIINNISSKNVREDGPPSPLWVPTALLKSHFGMGILL